MTANKERAIYHEDLKQKLIHEFTPIRRSKLSSKIYTQTEFIEFGRIGEESGVWKEFHQGQSKDGWYGYYRAYIFVPSYWKFATLPREDIAPIVEAYGGIITYKNVFGPDGTPIDRSTCIGWSYCYALDGETHLGKADVSRHVNDAVKAILDYELETEPDTMVRGLIGEVYSCLDRVKEATNYLEKKQIEYDGTLTQTLFGDLKHYLP